MRRFLIGVALSSALMTFGASSAQANEFNIGLASRYLETETFNDVFSDTPSLQVDGTLDLSANVYVSAYAYTGFERPFRDASSEYGFEAGYQHEIGGSTTITFAAGRYSNYGGRGFGAGDWYGKVEIEHGRLTASASVLSGETDSVLLHVAYELPVGDHLTVTPSVAFFTSDQRINPGLDATYRLSERVSVSFRCILPQDEVTGNRHFYAALALTVSFSGRAEQ